ncbi:MAG: hypothetical protein Q8N09_08350 [Thermodesulfovibrionia bacterium]|nr:hypothetical protein [Thermodesulfovibrionia bacterium]
MKKIIREMKFIIYKIPLTLSLSRKGRGDLRIPPPLTGGGEGEGGRGFSNELSFKKY